MDRKYRGDEPQIGSGKFPLTTGWNTSEVPPEELVGVVNDWALSSADITNPDITIATPVAITAIRFDRLACH